MNLYLDQLVAEKVMGWKKVNDILGRENLYEISEFKREFFNPSLNIQDAWNALDKVCKQNNWRAMIDRNQTYTEVTFKTQMGSCSQFLGVGETPTIAICKAVLDSVGIDVDKFN